MRRHVLQILTALLLGALLSSCVWSGRKPIERPLVYDVRDVSVIAGATVPAELLSGVDRRVSAAIGATRRTRPTERVVLTVKIERYLPAGEWHDRRASARFRVTAADVESGNAVAAGTFEVFSATETAGMVAESIAEEIAARIRFAFSLQTPRMTKPVSKIRPVTRQAATAKASAMPETAALPVADADPAAVSAEIGTNIESGAVGSISLSNKAAKPCDPATDPTCVPQGQ